VWIDGLAVTGNNYTGLIQGNRFADVAGGKHIKVTGSWVITGNSFEGGTIFDTSSGALAPVLIGNLFNTPGAIFSPLAPSRPIALGNVTPNTPYDDILPPRLAFGARGGPSGEFVAGATNGTEQLVVGVAGSLTTLGSKAGVYAKGSSSEPDSLILQSPSDANSREVQNCHRLNASSNLPGSRLEAGVFRNGPRVETDDHRLSRWQRGIGVFPD
jgi:hypothetical protein